MTTRMVQIADYEVIRPLGQGAQGTVYLARPPARLGLEVDLVAVKRIEHHAGEQEYRRVANEYRYYMTISSPWLHPVFDVGYQEARVYLTSAYARDGSLGSPEVGGDRAKALGAMVAAARGAHALHEAGIVHRGIKPQNVLLDGDKARLADLGLAQIMAPGMTTTGGRPLDAIEYLEPELVWGEPPGRASDIWSLGISLHTVLTGASPYPGLSRESVASAFQHVLHQRPTLADDLDDAARVVIERCLADDRAQRYPTADDVATAIEELAE